MGGWASCGRWLRRWTYAGREGRNRWRSSYPAPACTRGGTGCEIDGARVVKGRGEAGLVWRGWRGGGRRVQGGLWRSPWPRSRGQVAAAAAAAAWRGLSDGQEQRTDIPRSCISCYTVWAAAVPLALLHRVCLAPGRPLVGSLARPPLHSPPLAPPPQCPPAASPPPSGLRGGRPRSPAAAVGLAWLRLPLGCCCSHAETAVVTGMLQ